VTDDLRFELTFAGELVHWRGPSPFHFVPLPDEAAAFVREVAPLVTYGWGVIPVRAIVGATAFTTSLFPREGGYLLPIKDAVRRAERLALGDAVTVEMEVGRRGGAGSRASVRR
jgi:hypothetical protein